MEGLIIPAPSTRERQGVAACPRPMGGSPPVADAAAGRLPRIRRQAVPAATVPQRRARTDSRAVLRSPGSLSPRKITIKGAPRARPRYAGQTLDTELSRQDLGTYQEDGGRVRSGIPDACLRTSSAS